VHLQASWIFTTTDAQANLGVMAAGLLVWWKGSALPDLIIGTAIAALVLRGAVRILQLPAAPSPQDRPGAPGETS
jgi:Co/Zn/Cd efflux system component